MKSVLVAWVLLVADSLPASDVPQYSVVEWTFTGPELTSRDTPARDCTLAVRFRHELGEAVTVHGYWDGDGAGGTNGNVFKIRFCPVLPGTWTLVETSSNREELQEQREGETIECVASDAPGLWIADGRWYRRSDGSHPMIVGNTHYSFLSRYDVDGRRDGEPATDIAAQSEFFNKVRFSLVGCRYPDPDLKPFLDDEGRQTDDGRYSHRPNPRWFSERVDPVIEQGLTSDVVCDLILCGPDTREARSTLQGDNLPWLRYVAARYGSYPHVWFCLCNEWNIKEPSYSTDEIVAVGETLREHLPHVTTPVSVHANTGAWHDELNGDWCDHAIIQWKLKHIAAAADAADDSHRLSDGRPVVNDENAYQGEGDRFSEGDVIEGCFGTFLGGGYSTTGEKYGSKLGQYFWGGFDPEQHSAADNLASLRHFVDEHVGFWRMAPLSAAESPFDELPGGFRVLGNPGVEYVLGSNEDARIACELPPGRWRVTQLDLMSTETRELAANAEGRFEFTTPGSRAVLTHLQRLEDATN